MLRLALVVTACLAAVLSAFVWSPLRQRSVVSEAQADHSPALSLPEQLELTGESNRQSIQGADASSSSARAVPSDAPSSVADNSVDREELDTAAEVARLRAQCQQLERELDECRHPELTPLGAFVRLPEYSSMSEPTRKYIRGVLEELPVLLRPGEGAWIAQRVERKDWKLYGSSSTNALILFLGAGRVAAELSPAKLDELRQSYDDDEWARLFGNR